MTRTNQPAELDCPQCGNKVEWTEEFPYRPFCSKRCQMIDFGEWANEKHRIAGDPAFDGISEDDDMESN